MREPLAARHTLLMHACIVRASKVASLNQAMMSPSVGVACDGRHGPHAQLGGNQAGPEAEPLLVQPHIC